MRIAISSRIFIARGVSAEQASRRILSLAAAMMKTEASGYQLREDLTALA